MQSIMLISVSLLIVTTSTVCFAQTRLDSPEKADFVFEDDFEGERDESFWRGEGEKVKYGVTLDPKDPSNKVLSFTYKPNSETGGDSWAEYDFQLIKEGQSEVFQATQVEMSWRVYVPTNYKPFERNHKVFMLWSGPYGTVRSNVKVSSEVWPLPDGSGAEPSISVGANHINYGHTMNGKHTPLFLTGEGRWIHLHVYLELAQTEESYGRVEIYRDGELITGNFLPGLVKPYETAPIGPELIPFIRGGVNFIDRGTIFGWANGDLLNGVEPDTKDMVFLVDDFKLYANASVSETTNLSAPKGPTNVTVVPQD